MRTDSTIRAVRTLFDLVLVLLAAAAAVLAVPGLDEVIRSSPEALAAAASTVAVLTAAVTKVRNVFEDAGLLRPVGYPRGRHVAVEDGEEDGEDASDVHDVTGDVELGEGDDSGPTVGFRRHG